MDLSNELEIKFEINEESDINSNIGFKIDYLSRMELNNDDIKINEESDINSNLELKIDSNVEFKFDSNTNNEFYKFDFQSGKYFHNSKRKNEIEVINTEEIPIPKKRRDF